MAVNPHNPARGARPCPWAAGAGRRAAPLRQSGARTAAAPSPAGAAPRGAGRFSPSCRGVLVYSMHSWWAQARTRFGACEEHPGVALSCSSPPALAFLLLCPPVPPFFCVPLSVCLLPIADQGPGLASLRAHSGMVRGPPPQPRVVTYPPPSGLSRGESPPPQLSPHRHTQTLTTSLGGPWRATRRGAWALIARVHCAPLFRSHLALMVGPARLPYQAPANATWSAFSGATLGPRRLGDRQGQHDPVGSSLGGRGRRRWPHGLNAGRRSRPAVLAVHSARPPACPLLSRPFSPSS